MRLEEMFALFPGAFYTPALLVGLACGSFTGLAAYRAPRGLSAGKGRSVCDACGTGLGVIDLLPVAGYVLRRGRCFYCGERISLRYPFAELAGGAFAVFSLYTYGLNPQAPLAFAMIMGLMAAAITDADVMEIPDSFLLFLLFPAAGLAIITPNTDWLEHIIGAFCVSVPMLLMALAVPGGFGGGDIKLMAVAGIALGWKAALLAMFAALLSAGIYVAAMLIAKGLSLKSQFPFGPHLALGCVISLFFSERILDWYMGLL